MAIVRSPALNLVQGLVFIVVVGVLGTIGYRVAGWNATDSFYMVVITIFSVGYGEVRPIDTPFLRALTTCLIVLGCTGMIFMTGALVQLFTQSEIRRI